MASPSTLALRELQPRVGRLVTHTGLSREQRRHGVPPRVALHVMPPRVTIPRAAHMPASNVPFRTRMATLAPQLARRDRRIAQRDVDRHYTPAARAA